MADKKSRKEIHYGHQTIDQSDLEHVAQALRSGWLTQGPAVLRFEEELADYCGARHATAVSNGTMALQLACVAAGLAPGDEGITTPLTFMASANCISHCSARPVFADISPDTWNIDVHEVKRRISEKTKVVIPVDFAGLPCDYLELRELADEHGLTVIEDACHAIGASYRGAMLGSTGLAHMTCFSFHPVKNITAGEGGAILTNDSDLDRKLKELRHHGIVKDPAQFQLPPHGPWHHELHIPGFNARLSDIHAALGISQLGRLDAFNQRRSLLVQRYRERLRSIPGLTFQTIPDDRISAHHLFIIHLDPAVHDRARVWQRLQAAGIHPAVHYMPLHLHPFYAALTAAAPEDYPEGMRYYQGCLTLPLYPSLSDEDHQYVVDNVVAACQ